MCPSNPTLSFFFKLGVICVNCDKIHDISAHFERHKINDLGRFGSFDDSCGDYYVSRYDEMHDEGKKWDKAT